MCRPFDAVRQPGRLLCRSERIRVLGPSRWFCRIAAGRCVLKRTMDGQAGGVLRDTNRDGDDAPDVTHAVDGNSARPLVSRRGVGACLRGDAA